MVWRRYILLVSFRTPRASFTNMIPAWISHDDVIKWEHFPHYWLFVRGIRRSPVNSPHKGQWRGALMFFFDRRLNKQLSKQSRGWWFGTPCHPLWRHCNVNTYPVKCGMKWLLQRNILWNIFNTGINSSVLMLNLPVHISFFSFLLLF